MKKETKKQVYNYKLPKYRFFVWFQGLIDGKRGSAALNGEQIVQSGEIQMYQKRFQIFVGDSLRNLDHELHLLSAESEILIYELNKEKDPIPEYKPVSSESSPIEKRAAARWDTYIEKMKFERKKEREMIINRLIDIRTDFSDKETVCQENLLKMSAATEEILAVYCKGVMYRATLLEENIPVVNIEGVSKQFHDKIKWTHAAIERIDKEVLKYHENQ